MISIACGERTHGMGVAGVLAQAWKEREERERKRESPLLYLFFLI